MPAGNPCLAISSSRLGALLLSLALNPSARWETGLIEAWLIVQGGGLGIFGGTVTLESCNIHDNTASNVSLLLSVALNPSAPSPPGELA